MQNELLSLIATAPNISDDLVAEEIERERGSIDQGIARYRKEQRELREGKTVVVQDQEGDWVTKLRPGDGFAGTSAGYRIMQRAMEEFVPFIRDTRDGIEQDRSKGKRLEDWEVGICLLNPEHLAYLTVRAGLLSAGTGSVDPASRRKRCTLTAAAMNLAGMIALEFDYQRTLDNLRAAKDAMCRRIKSAVEKAGSNKKSNAARTWKNMRSRIDQYALVALTANDCAALGFNLLDGLAGICPDWLEIRRVYLNGGKSEKWLLLTETAYELIADHDARKELMQPLLRPMIVPPRDWSWTGTQYEGGYIQPLSGLIHSQPNAHTRGLDNPISPSTLSAINRLQATSWRVNRPVLEVMQDAWNAGLPIGKVPSPERAQMMPRVPDDQWDAMSADERQRVTDERKEQHPIIAAAEGKRAAFLSKLDVATDLVERPFWFPSFLDWRTRTYAMGGDATPQGNDHAKALLMFAEGKPLGDDGMDWLCGRAASLYGQDMDKRPLKERVQWVRERRELIRRVTDDPLGTADLWCQKDGEPWSFLATCFELAQAFDDERGFVSYLACPLDGSCNGLQHLAAMGRDKEGALATNVIASPDGQRRDIYDEVRALVEQVVRADRLNNDPLAHYWLDYGIIRAVVKRPTMTLAYGVTAPGIDRQLLDDEHAETHKQAAYLRAKILTAIDDRMVAARHIQGWFAEVAGKLAAQGIPFRWVTPTGTTIEQAYREIDTVRVNTLAGRMSLQVEKEGAGLAVTKQKNSSPNVVHSFDAAHLALTVNACAERYGMTSFATVHDSFGTHAANTTNLAATLRTEFAAMYAATNWLAEIERYVRSYAPGVEIPAWDTYVKLGKLDVTRVIDSPFFFS